MTYYRLTITTCMDRRYWDLETEFFMTFAEADQYRKHYNNNICDENGDYESHITSVSYKIEEVTFDQIKSQITLYQLEKLLNCRIPEREIQALSRAYDLDDKFDL